MNEDFSTGEDLSKRKLLSALCHGSIFFNVAVISVGVPIAILLISEDPVVKENAKESLNFHFNMWAYWLVVGVLVWLLIGWLLVPILSLVNFIFPIIALIKVFGEPSNPYRYPFLLRIL